MDSVVSLWTYEPFNTVPQSMQVEDLYHPVPWGFMAPEVPGHSWLCCLCAGSCVRNATSDVCVQWTGLKI